MRRAKAAFREPPKCLCVPLPMLSVVRSARIGTNRCDECEIKHHFCFRLKALGEVYAVPRCLSHVQLVNKMVVTLLTLGGTFARSMRGRSAHMSVATSGDRSCSLSSKLQLGSLALIAMLTSVGVTSNKPTLSVLAKMPSEMVLSSCLPTSRMHVYSEAHLHQNH